MTPDVKEALSWARDARRLNRPRLVAHWVAWARVLHRLHRGRRLPG